MTPVVELSRRALLSLVTRVAMADGVRDSGDFVAVRIDNFTFHPAALSLAVGQGVLWTNDDDVPHSIVHAAHPHLFRSHVLFPGDRFAHPFNLAGSFPYRCGIHPHMRGLVTVG